MMFTVFVVGALTFISMCKCEELQEKKKNAKLKAGDKNLREIIRNGKYRNKNKSS